LTDELETTDPNDNWPMPKYNAGSHYHIHALGVIAITYAQFQRSIDYLYAFHPREQKVPDELSDLYYFNLSEDHRIQATRVMFAKYEKDNDVKIAIENLLKYFQWCKHTRDQILHAEQYPAMFGGKPDTLYLTKRISKKSPKSGHMSFKLEELRSIADMMRAGVVQSAEIHIHLRVRDVPEKKIEPSLRAYKKKPLSPPLTIPAPLVLSATPN
jgi:hypothetical protein